MTDQRKRHSAWRKPVMRSLSSRPTRGTTVSSQLVSILVLLAVFLIATVLPVHMGALALVATFVVGYFLFQDAEEGYADTIFAFFPGDLFVILVGVTYLFAIAKNNGTVDWLVHAAVTAAGGRLIAIPWAMFAATGALTAIGGVVPAGGAIIAPVGTSQNGSESGVERGKMSGVAGSFKKH